MFREIGLADELGSAMRNSYKYTNPYSGGEPTFTEGDVFTTVIPLSEAATATVGPITQDTTQVTTQDTIQDGEDMGREMIDRFENQTDCIAGSRGKNMENSICFDQSMDFLTRMTEKYGDRIEFPNQKEPEKPKGIK